MAARKKQLKAVSNKPCESPGNVLDPEDQRSDDGEDSATGGMGEQADEELSLDEVFRLGGTRADYILLAGLEDTEELVDGGKKGAIDDLEEGELEKFITKLGIRAYAGQQVITDEAEGVEGEEESKTDQVKKSPVNNEKSGALPKLNDQQKDKKKTKKSDSTNSTGLASTGKKAKLNVNLFEFQPRQVLLVKPGGKWYDKEYTTESSSEPQDEALVTKYKALAQKLFEAETELYKNKKTLQKGANSAWMKTVVSTGTLADRMAAMTVLIQDAPVHTVEHVESLVAMVKKSGNRRMSLMAVDSLRELLISDLLPENRKLCTFSQHPFDQLEEKASGNRDARDRRLILWYFEHQLKHHVAEFVATLDVIAHDTVSANKAKALTTMHELLCQRPEQERALLVQLVNKLGDPEYKMAARASYLLETVLHQHPNMKVVVCSEVERMMFRPNIGGKAQYYAVCFLSQVLLSHEEVLLANKLITIYFSFFRACIKKKDVESKMLSALLSGVNRAYPYAKTGDEKVKEQLDTLFKVVHLVKFNTAVQALMLLFQVMDSEQTVSDRYYVALYRKLMDPGLYSCSKKSMFLNLIYKSLKADIILRRVKAFVKRLLQVSCQQNPTFACGALFLVSEVMKLKPGLKLLLQDSGDGDEEHFQDLAEEEDDDEECFVDADKLEEGQGIEAKPCKLNASWVHHQNLEGGKIQETYDPLQRNPLYCGADHSTLWELQRLSLHFHPSVSLFAKTILKGEFIQYTGDPLQDFTLIRFLDRFVFRNPKQLKGQRNTDAVVMQPKQKLSMNNVRSLPVNCKEFLSKEESQIPVDQIFFHRFFKKQEMEKRQRFPRGDGDDESVDDVDDEEFEKVLDSYEGDSYFTDLPEDRLDFASNMDKDKRHSEKDLDEDSDDSEMDDLDDEEVSLGSMEEEDFENLDDVGGLFMDPDGGDDDHEVPELEDDDDEFGGDDIGEEPDISPSTRKRKSEPLGGLSGSKVGKKRAKKNTAVFASAEEFGDMLDENAGSSVDNTGMNAMANKDKAAMKQLKWEAQRDAWIHGRDAKTLRRKKTMFKKSKMSGKPKAGKKTFSKKK